MKLFNKINIFILSMVFLLTFLSFSITKVNAIDNKFYNDNRNAFYVSNIEKDYNVIPGTRFVHDHGYTKRNGEKFDLDARLLFQKSNDKEGTKTVTWAVYDENHSVSGAYTRNTLRNIARDYERHHPGWKVIGGVNGDQYMWKYGTNLFVDGSDLFENHPYFALKADNENWFSIDTYGRYGCNLVGFKNDGSLNPIVFNPEHENLGFILKVFNDNDEVIGSFNINELNPKVKEDTNYTYVYALQDTGNTKVPISRDKESKSKVISSTNDLYIVKNASKAYVNNSVDYSFYKGDYAKNSFFGKGTINEINKQVTLTAKDFAVETTNPELLKLLKKDVKIICQYEIGGGYELCEAASGFHSIQRLNGKDYPIGGDYNNRPYPRSCMGQTKDGSIVLLNGNGTSKSGFTADEINALCKAYDITTLFQMDGGGSASMIVRNSLGELETVNEPSDGTDRHILSGVFFVSRDCEYEVEATNIESTKLDFKVNVKNVPTTKEVEEYALKLYYLNDNKEIELVEKIDNNLVSFTNLYKNASYYYTLLYKLKGESEYRESVTRQKIKTAKETPVLNELIFNRIGDDLKIMLDIEDPHSAVSGFFDISFDGGKTYKSFSGTNILLKDFTENPFMNLKFKYSYDLNDGKGQIKVDNIDFYKVVSFNVTALYDSILKTNNDFIDNIFN